MKKVIAAKVIKISFDYCVLFSLAPHPQKHGRVKLCLHALPALCYIGYLINSFYLLDINTKTALVRSQHIAYSAPYLYWDFCSRTLRLAYIAAAIVLCIRHGLLQYPAAKKLSVKKESLLTWLPSLVIAALVVLSGEWIIAAVKLIQFLQGDFDLDLLNILGLGNYYLAFLAINVVLLITAYPKRNTVQNHGASLHALLEHQTERGPSVLARVKEQRLYTQSDLTLQSLAQQLYISQRRLSQTIKEDLNTNFSDFINTLRVELAQQYLSQKQKVTITEVLYSVGFNSKSVFNTVFRQKTGMTPSAFRKHIQQQVT